MKLKEIKIPEVLKDCEMDYEQRQVVHHGHFNMPQQRQVVISLTDLLGLLQQLQMVE